MAARGSTGDDGLSVPVVDIRFPKVLLIWPVVFTTWMASFVSVAVYNGIFGEDGSAGRVPGSILMFVLFVVGPVVGIVGYGRSSARSHGTVLVVRSGFVTRRIPVEDIEGFVVVNQVGVRRDARMLVQPAIALRPGSASDQAVNGRRSRVVASRALRAVLRYFSQHRGRDLALICVPVSILSTRRMKRALAQLSRWHRWATAEVD